MPRLLRKKLVCFYCGCRSVQDRTPGIRKWQCEKCEAPNFLDENGEITDPPAIESSSETRFAQPIPRPASPVFLSPDESLFCSVCIQNQRFLTETLASYFPPSNAPDYSEYEKNYPEFRKNLEERYPQVCRKCEPQVLDRIRLTGYAAKSDHIRRMMERSRAIRGYQEGWSWKVLLVSAGALCWCTSQVGQLLWNAKGAFTTNHETFLAEESPGSLSACLWSLDKFSDTRICSELYHSTAGMALNLGLLSIWWNPRLSDKIRRESGRILGLQEYYKLQIMFLLVRLFSWTVLTRSPFYGLDVQMTKAGHSFMLIFTILSIIISFRTIQFDSTPIVLFQDIPGPLVQDTAADDLQSQSIQPLSQPVAQKMHNSRLDTRQPAFSINDLAPSLMRPRSIHHDPPTPPPDEDEFEAMDWTPSQKPLPPASKYRMPTPMKALSSPFYGHLPPAPISQSHKLRNPPNQLTFRRASTPQKQSFFQRALTDLDQDDISDIGSEFGSTITATTQSTDNTPPFNPPRFFPNSDHERDTGLESIFSKTFTLAEEPQEVRLARKLQPSNLVQEPLPPANLKLQTLWVILLLISCLAWYHPSNISDSAIRFRIPSLGVAAIIAIKGVIQALRREKIYWSWSNLFIYSSELCAIAFLINAVKVSSTGVEQSLMPAMASWFLVIMVLQELWILISSPWSPSPTSEKPQSAPEEPVSQEPQPPAPPPQDKRTPTFPSRTERKPDNLATAERTTRSKSRLEKSAATATGLNTLSTMSLGVSGSNSRRSTRRS